MTRQKDHPLRIAGVPEHFNYPWRLRNLWHCDDAVPIEYTDYSGGTGAMAKALKKDKTDLAILLTEGAICDIAKGGDHKIVKVYVDTPLEWGIHVAQNSPYESIEDIQGQRYAISRKGSGSHLMAAVHAHQMNWRHPLKFVKVRNLTGAREALPAGDAEIFFWEKTMTHPLVEAGEFRCLGTFQGAWPSFVVCASNQCLEQQPDRIKTVLQQINVIASELETSNETASSIAREFDLTVEASEQWLAHTKWNLSFDLPVDVFQDVLVHLDQLELGQEPGQDVADFCHNFEQGQMV